MSILFYDLETSGLTPGFHKIIQIAYTVCDIKTGIVTKQKNIILNDGCNDVDFYKKLENEIKTGVHPKTIITEVFNDFKHANKIVSYSGDGFDERFINHYFNEYFSECLLFNNRIDVMNICSEYFKTKIVKGKRQWLKLTDVYQRFGGKNINNAHNAFYDVDMLIHVHNSLVNNGIIKY
jgi:uncharacterized protein YprB with RNaseH-like and TPR domain